MIELHLLRHARAGNPEGWDGPDATRPLTDEGRRQAERLAELLRGAGLEADAILSSPKVRALQTAELVAAALGVDVRLDDRLASGTGFPTVNAILTEAGSPRRPILVGHDPDLSTLLSLLVDADLQLRMGSMARIDVEELRPGGGTLRWLLAPEILPG